MRKESSTSVWLVLALRKLPDLVKDGVLAGYRIAARLPCEHVAAGRLDQDGGANEQLDGPGAAEMVGVSIEGRIRSVFRIEVVDEVIRRVRIGHTRPPCHLLVAGERRKAVDGRKLVSSILLPGLYEQRSWRDKSTKVRRVHVLTYVQPIPHPAGGTVRGGHIQVWGVAGRDAHCHTRIEGGSEKRFLGPH